MRRWCRSLKKKVVVISNREISPHLQIVGDIFDTTNARRHLFGAASVRAPINNAGQLYYAAIGIDLIAHQWRIFLCRQFRFDRRRDYPSVDIFAQRFISDGLTSVEQQH